MKSVEDLDVFKLAHQLTLNIYSATKSFPRTETFSLVDQMRRVDYHGAKEIPTGTCNAILKAAGLKGR
jgi:hypothetical protein